MRTIVHLTASSFLGGPERQVLGLAPALPDGYRSVYVSFAEAGRCRPFVAAARQQGCEGVALEADWPRARATLRELTAVLDRVGAGVLLCHGYKANLLGRIAARRHGCPVVGLSRGWTAESWRVRLYEWADRRHLRFLDRVVAVSQAQADKVRRCGVHDRRLRVIANAIDPERFSDPDPEYRARLVRHFASPPSRIVAAAGRLSPEKGFDVLVAAASILSHDDPSLGFIVFGEGKCRQALHEEIVRRGLGGSFVLAGFRNDLDRFLPHIDLMVLPSFTEGMPNVVLEALAAGVPVVATAVGGTPEVIENGVSGYLVPPGDPATLAERINQALESDEQLHEMGFQGRQRVLELFSFGAQARKYVELFTELGCPPAAGPRLSPRPLSPLHTGGPKCPR